MKEADGVSARGQNEHSGKARHVIAVAKFYSRHRGLDSPGTEIKAGTFQSSGAAIFRVITPQQYGKRRMLRMLYLFLICTDLEAIKCHVAMKVLWQQCTKTKLGIGKHTVLVGEETQCEVFDLKHGTQS